MQVSDEQFEQLVGMIAESRVELRQGISDLQFEIRTGFSNLHKNQIVTQSEIEALIDDVKLIQRTQRDQGLVLGELLQATDGLTQLCKTNFDLTESIMKRLLGEESGTVSHGQESHGSSPQ